ncbi:MULTISPECIES: M17 family metallopeptidase [Methylotenera]|uniref:M17 family metallopeptidase n=1 Tax=Methylotenera TaxID=359407 RepID=UPI00036E5F96|nr:MULTISPECIES: leucyl aminopeptidase family protein [Methylotenera]
MSVKLSQFAEISDEKTLSSQKHSLFVLDEAAENKHVFSDLLQSKLKRSQAEYKSLNKTPVTLDLPNGGVASFVVLTQNLTVFQKHTLLRKAVKPLLDENPESLAINVYGDEVARETNACAAYYVTAVNAAELPSRKNAKNKQGNKHTPLKEISIYGYKAANDYAEVNVRVAANTLCRSLTILPPNELTPAIYREKVSVLAKQYGWQHEEFDMPALKKMGAGAFYAVGQGSEPMDAAIVHLTYSHVNPKKHIALVGKGICFDTGGHNLKPAKYMQGMHEDMNGSAVALSVLQAATEMKLEVKIDCWLAIAQNHIGPLAYKQNDVVTALNGMSIEIVHTDAEGRMVLADTLTLASRQKPDVILDYATLTGSMAAALSDRMSGILANRPELSQLAVAAGAAAGERIVAFPNEEDFDSDLESDIADIKQCTLEGGGDHIHATRFMGNFIENDVAWCHADLSSTNRKGGLGAVQSDVNGFGVGFALEMIKALIRQ